MRSRPISVIIWSVGAISVIVISFWLTLFLIDRYDSASTFELEVLVPSKYFDGTSDKTINVYVDNDFSNPDRVVLSPKNCEPSGGKCLLRVVVTKVNIVPRTFRVDLFVPKDIEYSFRNVSLKTPRKLYRGVNQGFKLETSDDTPITLGGESGSLGFKSTTGNGTHTFSVQD